MIVFDGRWTHDAGIVILAAGVLGWALGRLSHYLERRQQRRAGRS